MNKIAAATATYHVVRVVTRPCDAGQPHMAFFGDHRTVHDSWASAQEVADTLASRGEWGQDGPPEYYVEECSFDDLRPAERREVA